MAKIYTRTGDNGKTNLYNRRNVPKYNMIFEVLGDLDELSAHIGILASLTDDNQLVKTQLRAIQNRLLDIGSDLSMEEKREQIVPVNTEDIKDLEHCIDYFSGTVEPLRAFILPGYHVADAHAHLCRTVCRRTERKMWLLYDSQTEEEENIYTDVDTFRYMNRLSDYFFALARYLSGGREQIRGQSASVITRSL